MHKLQSLRKREVFLSLKRDLAKSVQAAFVAEEWVDHALGQAHEAEGKLEATEKAHAVTERRLKDTLFHLAEVEKSQKNAKSALIGYEKQVEEARVSLKKAETQLALAIEKTKQQQKQLKAKDIEKAKAEQAAYDAGITKTAQSLTAQLQDVARAFCLELWGEALNEAGVSTELELRAPNKLYYPPALRLAPGLTQPLADPSSSAASAQPTTTSTATLVAEKEQDQTLPISGVDVDSEEVAKVGQLKRKKKEKEKEAST
ncbi:hypothetical protein SO802_009621 [Lithocarpus litseifolius]|uniref:Uncharacterized protein n=1 Tax=Lithocarpus litseifolius TaxID=425828 RepID=A0AAW2DD99_9ROSI